MAVRIRPLPLMAEMVPADKVMSSAPKVAPGSSEKVKVRVVVSAASPTSPRLALAAVTATVGAPTSTVIGA